MKSLYVFRFLFFLISVIFLVIIATAGENEFKATEYESELNSTPVINVEHSNS